MSLRRKILLKDGVLLISLLLLIAASMFGLWRQRQHIQASLSEYSALKTVEAAELQLLAFQQTLHDGAIDSPQALTDLRAALSDMIAYKSMVSQYDNIFPPEITPDLRLLAKTKTKSIVTELVHLTLLVNPPKSPSAPNQAAAPLDTAAISNSIELLSRQLADLSATCNGFVHRTQLESDRDLRITTIAVASLAGCILVIALFSSSWQYRRIVVPLSRLRRWCRIAASGDFSVAYQPTADREFQELGRDVNKMAEELNAFYRKLESMVAVKSRELVRSERLASVGYLAAGVAHEINTPLNVMSGYAELSLKRLGRLPPDSVDPEVVKHLAIIHDEAFRCKEITHKLLSLAKGNGEASEIVSMTDAVTEVSKLVRGLKTFREKKLEISIDDQERLLVRANLTEMKQVLLNLVTNAIEAVEAGTGEVYIEGRRTADCVEVDVSDNGWGMSEETVHRVFEPFFTNKRGSSGPGTGLGLSITHAIITHHGGEILVHSDGPGRGSRFTIRLPSLVQSPPIHSISHDTLPVAEPVA